MSNIIENQIVNALSKKFSITTEIIQDGDDVSLIVNSHLSGKIIFTQTTPLNQLIEIITSRIEKRVYEKTK